MRAERLEPDLVWCSTARRARQTWAVVGPELANDVVAIDCDDLYMASGDRILDMVRRADDHLARLMIVAHNPGLHELAVSLADRARNDRDLAKLRAGLPTAALAVITFDTDRWGKIGQGVLDRFIRPKDL